ncbi:MAG: NAD-dependent epimerase/dehydratase family protein [Opitutales bacterium]
MKTLVGMGGLGEVCLMASEGIVLVTGGAGFIGRWVVRRLVAQGARVRVLDLQARPGDCPAGVDYQQGSILEEDDVKRALAGVDRLVHAAGIADLWLPDPQVFREVNAFGTMEVLEQAEAARVSKFVHVSSETILRDWRNLSREPIRAEGDLPPFPKGMPGPYTRSKWTAESDVREAAEDRFPAVIVYPTMPLGPGDDALTPPTRMLLDFLRKPPPAILNCALNVVDVRDVAAGIVAALEYGKPGERFILGGENLHLRDLMTLLHQAGGQPPPKRTIPYALGWLAACVMEHLIAPVTRKPPQASVEGIRLARLHLWSDCSPAAERLGWSPRPAREAVNDAVAWLREAGHWSGSERASRLSERQ